MHAWINSHSVPATSISVVPPQMREGPDWYLGAAEAVRQNLELVCRTAPERVAIFGAHILPRLVPGGRVYAYDFQRNTVPGVRDYEETGYWRDVGTLDAYYAANMDLLGERPRFDLFNPPWRIHSNDYQGPSPRIDSAGVADSIIGAGTRINGGVVRHSIVRREVTIEAGAVIEDSMVMDYCVIRRGAHIRRAIIDRYNVVEAGDRIGFDRRVDERRFSISEGGVVVLPKAVPNPSIPRYY